MKSVSVSLSFAILYLLACASCKNGNDVNPATTAQIDSFVGVYDSQSTVSYGRTGAIATERPQNTTLTVSKSTYPNGSNTLLFHEQYLGFSRDYSVYMDGSSFIVDKMTEQVSVNGTMASGIMNGIGKFSADGKSVSLSTSTDVDVAGPYNRSVKIEGSKK